ncbi:VOC family protein [Bordetella petrii]|uniref:VOC family protein n=1 Tax=Bordetella petrii TaxID=94624 RepID=UPI001E3ECCC0|nr:VOC family protein [Bordetella petrii]MCD0501448.1 VOC family protein [Bordetella petrii]
MHVLINIDVDDLDRAIQFYRDAFGLEVTRRFGGDGAELMGAGAPLYLLRKAQGSRPAGTVAGGRDYARHWTPVHLDFVVDDVDAAVESAVAAGASLENPAQTHAWGRIAHLSDPFGHGLCILQFLGQGYDAVSTVENNPP